LRPDAVVPSVLPLPLGASALPQPAVVVGLLKTPELPPLLLVLAPELLVVLPDDEVDVSPLAPLLLDEPVPPSPDAATEGGSSPPQQSRRPDGNMHSAHKMKDRTVCDCTCGCACVSFRNCHDGVEARAQVVPASPTPPVARARFALFNLEASDLPCRIGRPDHSDSNAPPTLKRRIWRELAVSVAP
jgi:hypothetical protein